MPDALPQQPDILTTPERQARYARIVLEAYGSYLRLSDPETYAYYVEKAKTPSV